MCVRSSIGTHILPFVRSLTKRHERDAIVDTGSSCTTMNSLFYVLNEINPLVQCSLCQGYLVDPYTIKECMHSFCRTCILSYFEHHLASQYQCPRCYIKLQPFSDLSKLLMPDRQLGDIVHALLPSLVNDEIRNEKVFYEENSLAIPNDLHLKLRLVEQPPMPMRYIDKKGRTRLQPKDVTMIGMTTKPLTIPISLQIELCEKYIDPLAFIKQRPRKYLCLSSQLQIHHVRKYIETICQMSATHRVYLFFYDSCLKDCTPLLLIRNRLFPAHDCMKLFFSIIRNKSLETYIYRSPFQRLLLSIVD
jgi:hypothetical protein